MNDSLAKVIECIDKRASFILEAGAGSGKTWSLIESLKHILTTKSEELKKNSQHIVCITYTNVAKNEIQERIAHDPLVLTSTFHDFLWSVLVNYQAALRVELAKLNAASKEPFQNFEEIIKGKQVHYSMFGRKYEEGAITHDDVISLAKGVFQNYPKIALLAANQYPYIFVDEYQDTDTEVVDLLLNDLLSNHQGKVTLGFFGDSMQKIYSDKVGIIESDKLIKITKEENFRCSKAVISLLNKMRPALQQEPQTKNLEGQISFFHCNSLAATNGYEKVLGHLQSQGWVLTEENPKILMLTHRGIASKLGYANLIKTYTDFSRYGRERLYDKEDAFSSLFFNKIEKLCELYENKHYNEVVALLGKERCQLNWHKDKTALHDSIAMLNALRAKSNVQAVLQYVYESGLFSKSTDIKDFERKVEEKTVEGEPRYLKFYNTLMGIPYAEVVELYKYIEDHTPFSTKHGVKGAEFDDVLVVIDDSLWKAEYNFNYLFAGSEDKSQFNKSLNLFYVCCSRAKNRLAVLALSKIDMQGMQKVTELFGADNVYDVSRIKLSNM